MNASTDCQSAPMLTGEPKEEAQANVKEKNMFAVIKTGGKQYRVQEGDVVAIILLEADVDSKVTFDDVLMAGEGDNVKIGTPALQVRLRRKL